MTITDPFAHFDAAYVLGALSDEDRDAFEAHLVGCDECRARVDEVADIPRLLSGVPMAAFDLPEPLAEAGPPPDTLLPALLRQARAERRRSRGLAAFLGGLAAACLVALVVAVWPSGTSQSPAAPKPVALSPLVATPVQAGAIVSEKSWGTQIELICEYDNSTPVPNPYGYHLVVTDAAGKAHELGTWSLVPGRTIRYTSGTSLTRSEIASIEITSPTDKPILRLSL